MGKRTETRQEERMNQSLSLTEEETDPYCSVIVQDLREAELLDAQHICALQLPSAAVREETAQTQRP